ncbi:MAG: MmgE/PrpD family protein [Candidatus Tectimicrobiota bacterium]
MAVDPALTLAEHVCRTTYAALPASTVWATKRDMLDTFGAALGGSVAPGVAELASVIRHWGGREESSLWLLGGRVPAPQAAMLNATMGHALDFDDTFDRAGSIHPGTSVLAAAMAVAEMQGGASGREVILAAALGLDVACRVALAATVDRGWHRTAAMGVFGATATAGKLLGLSPEQMLHAFGIAYSQAAGNRQCIVDGALTKRLQAGQAASSGVFAAILAREGFTGAQNVFAGRYGFYQMYQPDGADLQQLTEGLGTIYRGEELSFKPYPCGRRAHATLDVALEMYQHLELATAHAGADIAEVLVTTDPLSYRDQFEAGPHKRRPTQVVEAQFSTPFLVAAGLALGKIGIGEVAGVDNPQVLALAARIQGAVRPGMPEGWAEITVRRTDGRTATLTSTHPYGSPERPLSDAQLAAKFRDCAAHALRPLTAAAVEQAIATVMQLEDSADAVALLRLCAAA